MKTFSLVVTLALFAGCMGGDETPNERRFTASDGLITAGWSYDGASALGRGATLEGVTFDAENAGSVNVTFELDGAPWVVRFERFAEAPDRAFQDGGVAHDLSEHGDSGVADTSIPRILALSAAWGTASVTKDGALVTSEPWSAHLMVAGDTVRGQDGKILKADGASPYDPANAGDARRIEGDPQAILWVKHPQGETFAREPALVQPAPLTCAAPECSGTGEVPVEPGALQAIVNVTFMGPQEPVPVSVAEGTVRILDATGAELATQGFQVTPVAGANQLSFPLDSPPAGILTVEVTGRGAYTAVIDATVVYQDRPFLVFTWDEPAVG